MQRIEIAGLNRKRLPIERLGLVKLSALVMLNGSPKRVGKLGFADGGLICGLGMASTALRMQMERNVTQAGATASESCARLFACGACVQAGPCLQDGIGTGPISFGTL